MVTVKQREKILILHLERTFKTSKTNYKKIKTSKKDSSQRKRQTDGMYSNKWVGVINAKHMSKDNNNSKKKQIKAR